MMKTWNKGAVVVALAVAAIASVGHAVEPGADGGTPGTSIPAEFKGSKAGVFVLSFAPSAEDAGAVSGVLNELSAGYAGIGVGVVGGDGRGGVPTVEDPGGAMAQRLGASAGEFVVIDAAGAEIARFGKGTAASVIGARIEKSRRAPTDQYNVPGKTTLALDGYDPVSYFDSAKPSKGNAGIVTRYRGVVYRFASAASRAKFNAEPEKYVPTYGGWCATAMARGEKVEVDPTNFKVSNGRLFLFYKGFLGNAKNDWEKDEKRLERDADGAWAKIAK